MKITYSFPFEKQDVVACKVFNMQTFSLNATAFQPSVLDLPIFQLVLN